MYGFYNMDAVIHTPQLLICQLGSNILYVLINVATRDIGRTGLLGAVY